mmetsp:Transcript_7806/g.14831  ORF Transcript_7806/g.14831 Transcript_7806/m.14831 type:complete len:132 (+) Transcript_7806:86-481(+)
MVSITAEENNGVTANQTAQRVGKRTSSPAPKATLNGGAPKADPKAQAAADGKPQDAKPSEKPPALGGMAGLVARGVCVDRVHSSRLWDILLDRDGNAFRRCLEGIPRPRRDCCCWHANWGSSLRKEASSQW